MQLDVPVVGILRGVEEAFFSEIMHASFTQGLQAIEVTMNTDRAEKMVAENRDAVPPGKLLGMGTVRNLKEAERAIGAGAMFLVTPNLDPEVIKYSQSKNIPIITGALTPSEVYQAWTAGADMVKVFPCGAMGGARYIHSLLGPFDRISLVAVGGVTDSNVVDYLSAGAKAVGVGDALFGKEALQKRDIEALAGNVKKFVGCCLTGKKAF